MSKLIAFVSRISIQEEQSWVAELQTKLSDCDIRAFSQLTQEDKKLCKLAVVANPDPNELKQLSNLVWVQSVWAGVDSMMSFIEAGCEFEIARLIDPNLTETMTEAVLAWSFYLHRNMPVYKKQQQELIWSPQPYIQAQNRTIGILGLGKLGLASAKRLKMNGFNMMGWSRALKHIDNITTFADKDGLQEMVARCDILVNLLPSTSETKGLLNQNLFAYCKQGMGLINFGRGSVIVEKDLIQALDNHLLSHAVLDVFLQEPLAIDHAFWQHEKITVLPHISAPTSLQSAADIVSKNINHYFLTGALPEIVDRHKGY